MKFENFFKKPNKDEEKFENLEKDIEKEQKDLEKNLEEYEAAVEEMGGEKAVEEGINKLGEDKIKAILERLSASINKIGRTIKENPGTAIYTTLTAAIAAAGLSTGNINVAIASPVLSALPAGLLNVVRANIYKTDQEHEEDYYEGQEAHERNQARRQEMDNSLNK